ncbi:PiggyBac transposable element-derived protein 4 [Labeo rohita]|uniref:PiggyBac transposable element-derived protein 4 n=1 Tax=Labeo rohita TaxID=84645 RepID=A0ABQ8L4M1_LABRO|nr:PiggyBac transposable element-derived protein 4 [Labeo rohita]
MQISVFRLWTVLYNTLESIRGSLSNETKNFLGLFFLTGIIHKPQLDVYLSTDEMLATPYFSKVISRNRFKIICRFLHFNDNKSKLANDTDKLYKVSPSNTNICIDEGMLLWCGRLGFRMYNPQKSIKHKNKTLHLVLLKDTAVSLLVRPAGHGYRLFMDIFYNSVPQSKHLHDLKTHVCGTIRK